MPPDEYRVKEGAITEKIFSNSNANSSYGANISWNAEEWFKSHKIEFFHVTIEEIPRVFGGFHYTNDISANAGVSIITDFCTCKCSLVGSYKARKTLATEGLLARKDGLIITGRSGICPHD